MAVGLLAREVSDLYLGKPPLRSLPVSSTTIADALSVLKRSGEVYVSLWSCDHGRVDCGAECMCVGKVCMVDVILFLCREDNLRKPLDALQSPVAELIPKGSGVVRHLEPNSSLLEAIDCILEGAQNLVIPIHCNRRTSSRKKLLTIPSVFGFTNHKGQEFCWLTQEDIVRFLINTINVFNPIPTFSIELLGIINMDILTIHYNEPAFSALSSISESLEEQTSVAVVDDENRLIGEISPVTLACCEETVAAAIATLSAGDLMSYIDFGIPPEELVLVMKTRLQEKNLMEMLDMIEDFSLMSSSSASSCCSSDEEFGSGRFSGLGRFSPARRSEAIVCHRGNSLMAVMVQMIAHRTNYAWVVEEDYILVGIVTFAGILRELRRVSGAQKKL